MIQDIQIHKNLPDWLTMLPSWAEKGEGSVYALGTCGIQCQAWSSPPCPVPAPWEAQGLQEKPADDAQDGRADRSCSGETETRLLLCFPLMPFWRQSSLGCVFPTQTMMLQFSWAFLIKLTPSVTCHSVCVVVLAFHHCDKIPDVTTYKVKRFLLPHFRRP